MKMSLQMHQHNLLMILKQYAYLEFMVDSKIDVGPMFISFRLGAIFILHKDIGVGGWSRKWQFPLKYFM